MATNQEKLNRLAQQTDKIITEMASNGDFNFLLKEVPNIIKIRTQLGKGVSSNGGKLSALKKLESDKYKELRKKSDKLSSNTTPNRSNLTATGQLLDAIRGERSGNEFRFFFISKRNADLSGRTSKATNQDIVKGQEEQGRPFFFLSKTELTRLSRSIRDAITGRISNLFK